MRLSERQFLFLLGVLRWAMNISNGPYKSADMLRVYNDIVHQQSGQLCEISPPEEKDEAKARESRERL